MSSNTEGTDPTPDPVGTDASPSHGHHADSPSGPPALGAPGDEPSAPPGGPLRPLGRFRKARRRLTVAFIVTGLLGVLLLGAWGGHWFWPKEVVEASRLPRTAPSAIAQSGSMPDVLGLREVIARRAVRDAGVSVPVTITARPAAGPEGLVVDQIPAAGATGARVTLTISSAATVIPVIGTLSGDARGRLEALGALVTVRQVVAPTRTPGSVVAVRPVVGAPLPTTVELDVAGQGDELALADVDAIAKSQCERRSGIKVGSSIFDQAISCRHDDATQVPSMEFDLAARTQALTMTVGLDNEGASAPATVTVSGNGKQLWRSSLIFGTPVPVTIPTGGIIRLQITVLSASVGAPTVVVGSPTLLGDKAQLDGLR